MMKGPEALEALARIVVFDSRWWLRKRAIAMAGRVSPSRAAAMANGLSKDAEPEVREAAARLLKGQTDELSLSILERLLADEDIRVRAAARDAAARGGVELPEPDISEPAGAITDYVEILRWAERPRAAVITVERPGFMPGMFTVRLDTAAAPLTSWRFARLAAEGYYDGQQVDRVVPGLLVQSGGDVKRPEAFHPEISPSPFNPGRVGMVADGQWFISLAIQPLLSPDQTAFGNVVQNFPGVVSLLLPGDRITSVKIYEGDGSEELELP
jgi:cyclophilin family peptidyl-prolyl cis-trans isomerase